jgi:pteridine reductase
MTTNKQGNDRPVVLVTGSAQRIGAAIVSMLHTTGYNTVIHYRHSSAEADALVARLNAQRKNSATAINADLNDIAAIRNLATRSLDTWGRIDALVNSASAFYPTPVATATEQQWDDLISSNMKAPFFLSQALAPALATQQGSIINIADIYAEKPLHEHTIYCMAKAANVMLTKSLARELAPQVRVNGIAPGAILWPETGGATNEGSQQSILEKIPLKRTGTAEDIASTVLFLLRDVPYISGQIIAVDGGRSIFM